MSQELENFKEAKPLAIPEEKQEQVIKVASSAVEKTLRHVMQHGFGSLSELFKIAGKAVKEADIELTAIENVKSENKAIEAAPTDSSIKP